MISVLPIQTDHIEPFVNLKAFFINIFSKKLNRVQEKDILVIASKIISLSEGNIVNLNTIHPSKKARQLKISRYGKGKEDPRIVQLVINESEKLIPGNILLAYTHGILAPAAGIDLSNVPKGYALLLPKNPQKSALAIWSFLRKTFGIKKLGVIIADSHCVPLRLGTQSIALGFAGLYPVRDYRGKKDLQGKKFEVTRLNVTDNIACAALLGMGEGAERKPLVIVRGVHAAFTTQRLRYNRIAIKPEQCMYSGLYEGSGFRVEGIG